MKRHSRNTLVSLTALALGATVLLTGCSEDAAGSTAETASAPAAPVQSSDTTATGATAAQTSELLASLTHEEMEELISGNTTLAELEQKRFNLPSSGTSDAATVSPEDAAAAQAPAASSTSASPAEAPSSYDVELQALINQLYAVKANAESGLNSAIQSAKDEYHALPADKQTATRKVSIVMSSFRSSKPTVTSRWMRSLRKCAPCFRKMGRAPSLPIRSRPLIRLRRAPCTLPSRASFSADPLDNRLPT